MLEVYAGEYELPDDTPVPKKLELEELFDIGSPVQWQLATHPHVQLHVYPPFSKTSSFVSKFSFSILTNFNFPIFFIFLNF